MKKQLLKLLLDVIEAGIRYGYPAFIVYSNFGLGISVETVISTKVKIGVGVVILAFLAYFFFRHWIKDRINEMPHYTTFLSVLRSVLAWIYESIPYCVLFGAGLLLYKIIPSANIADIEAVQTAYNSLTTMMRSIAKVFITAFICFNVSKIVNICVIRPLVEGIAQDEFEHRLKKSGEKK